MLKNLFLGGILLAFIACDKLPKANNQMPENFTDGVPANFMEFYEMFHADTTFQKERILFPLDGKPESAPEDFVQGSFSWNKDTWVVHKPLDMESGEYKRQFGSLNEHFVTEIIQLVQMDYGIERRFAKVGGKWMLVYYSGMNPL